MGAKHGEFRELITAMFRERHKHPHLTVNLLRRHWADILGRELADKTYPARIAGQTLWINALDASWAYQLQFMKHELLESVQVFMDAAEITDLRFKQGELFSATGEEQKKDPGSSTESSTVASVVASTADKSMEVRDSADVAAPDSTAPDDTEEEAATATTAVISDDSLRNSFRRWARVKKRKTRSGD